MILYCFSKYSEMLESSQSRYDRKASSRLLFITTFFQRMTGYLSGPLSAQGRLAAGRNCLRGPRMEGTQEGGSGDKTPTGGIRTVNSVPDRAPSRPDQPLAGGDALATPAEGRDFGGQDAVSECGGNGSPPAAEGGPATHTAALPSHPGFPPPCAQARACPQTVNRSRGRAVEDAS